MKFKLSKKLDSRKLWLAILAGLIVALNRFFDLGLSEGEVNKIVLSLLSYVFVEGGADVVSRLRSGKK